MRRGDLLPDELVVRLISERLRSVDFEQGAVLDGCPSTIEQAVGLDRELELRGQRFEHVVHLYAPINVLLERLSHRASAHRAGEAAAGAPSTFPSGNSEGQHNSQDRTSRRQDDAPHVVRRRLEVYIQNIKPVVEYYQAQGVVREVMADAPKEVVKARVLRAIGVRSSFPDVGRDEDEKQSF
jgi:adenylate kinase